MAFVWWRVGTEVKIVKNESGNQKSREREREMMMMGIEGLGDLE